MNRKQRRASKGQESTGKATPVADPLWAAFQEGFQHQGAGRFSDAERIYKKILEINPHHAHSLHMMGLMAFDRGSYEAAEELMRQAIGEQDNFALFHGSLGNALKAQKKYDDAIIHYTRALELKPDFVDCLSNLGSVFLNLGKKAEASELFEKAVAINPKHFISWNNLGAIALEEAKYDDARKYYERAIEAKADFAEAHKNLGLLLKQIGDLKEATVYFRNAIKYRPDYVDAMSDLANVLRDQNQYDEAKKYYELVASMRLDGYALSNIASILKQQGRVDEAIPFYERALALTPGNFEMLNNLGTAQSSIGKFKEAVTTYKEAIKIEPSQGGMFSNLGVALKSLGQLDESLEYLQRAIVLTPNQSHIYSNLLLTMVYAPFVSPEDLMATAVKFGEIVAPLRREKLFLNSQVTNRKLKIGYVSPDFYNHAVHYFFEPLLLLHNRSQFEIYAYSNTQIEDHVTERIKSKMDHWRDIRFVDNAEVADMIEKDQIDILVDLSGHTGSNRLLVFAIKPAPVQVSWLGYPATTGMKTMDYRITDVYAEPEGMTEHLNVEKLYRLPDVFCCYQPHENSPAIIDHPPFEDNGFITFGCFNNFSKVTDDVMKVWARVLERVPDSRLLIEIAGIHESEFRSDVLKRLERAGLPVERVLLEPRKPSNQFTLYNKIDMALDPFPCNGGTTSFDTLWMGVPFVTLEGRHFVSRMGVTILTNAGLKELVARDADEYVGIAADLANDRSRLKAMRQGLREKTAASPLMDQQRFVRNMEAAYHEMWKTWCREQSDV